ncbi:hypothetical protein CBF30_01760 [Vagococcus entomophilus]|uniref:Uncharacterized protein n=2 Tax=Vagococcus entomophilus TaxID=1160095 RepID=A0A430AIS6_9ENTE|nr:hypothetical protein CBF30_01760 [Vagococcus entomophilus]
MPTLTSDKILNTLRFKTIMTKDIKTTSIEVDANASVDFTDLFTNAFMKEHTSFSDIYSFFEKGGFKAKTNEDFEKIDEKSLDAYIIKQTDFSSWLEMLAIASNEYIATKFEQKK